MEVNLLCSKKNGIVEFLTLVSRYFKDMFTRNVFYAVNQEQKS
jgi:hypothetical protein